MSKIFDLTEGSIFKKLFLIALPVLLTSISQMAYNLTDMFWVGRVDEIGLIEHEAISAIGTAGYIIWFAFGVILIGRVGTGVKVSHAAGSKNLKALEQYASNGILWQLFIGILFSALVFILKKPIIGIFAIDSSAVIGYALEYLSIVGGLLVFQFVSSGFMAINEGIGKTKINFLIMAIGLVLNMVLDPILILGLRLGVRGAAIATIISQALTMLVFTIVYLKTKEKLFRFHVKAFNLATTKEIIRIGIPAGLQSMVFTTISIFIARMVFGFGEIVMAAQRIGTQVEQLTWMIAGGFQTALTVYVGQNFGAKQYLRVRKGIGAMSGLLIPYSFVVALSLFFFAEGFMSLFVDDPLTKAYGIRYLKIISLAQVFMMIEAIGVGFFNGIGKTEIPSLVGIIGNTLRIPLAYLLISSMNEEGIWWALNISDITKGMILFIGALIMMLFLEKLKPKKQKIMMPVIENTTENVA
ncbi:MAG: MATE family efflux transporter [Candidatus Izemoplasmatales bacterium]|nr:MATE family efflux transporter [Candidatus Izemoplasmatales bacterium]